MSTDDRLTMALFHLEQDIAAGRAPAEVPVIEIPWTLERAIATFLNRWCHRALGDRDAAERELNELIDLARASTQTGDMRP